MKTISAGLTQHPRGRGNDARHLLEITRRNGVVQGFTDHIRGLEVDGVTDNGGERLHAYRDPQHG